MLFGIISFCQDNAAMKEQLKQLLCVSHPSVLLSCRPAQASEVKVSERCLM